MKVILLCFALASVTDASVVRGNLFKEHRTVSIDHNLHHHPHYPHHNPHYPHHNPMYGSPFHPRQNPYSSFQNYFFSLPKHDAQTYTYQDPQEFSQSIKPTFREAITAGKFSRAAVEMIPPRGRTRSSVSSRVPLRDAVEAAPDNSLTFYITPGGVMQDYQVNAGSQWVDREETEASILDSDLPKYSFRDSLGYQQEHKEEDIQALIGKFSRGAVESPPSLRRKRDADDDEFELLADNAQSVAGADQKLYITPRNRGHQQRSLKGNSFNSILVSTDGLTDTERTGCLTRGYFRSSLSCDEYFVCAKGRRYRFQCQQGLVFDEVLKLCNWPRFVKCTVPDHAANEISRAGDPCRPSPCAANAACMVVSHRARCLCKAGYRGDARKECEYIGQDNDFKWRSAGGGRVVCYFSSWAWYRGTQGKFLPEHLPSQLCTHVVYAFGSISQDDLVVESADTWTDYENGFIKRVIDTTLRNNPGTQVLLGLGGWADSSSKKYSQLVNSPHKYDNFTSSVVRYLQQHGFDGLSFDWTFPVCHQFRCHEGPESDRIGFTNLIRSLRRAFDAVPRPLLLTATISGYPHVVDKAYDIPQLAKQLDFMNVMSYDYHGSWEKQTGHISPLQGQGNKNTETILKHLVGMGADKEQLVVGLPFYGQSFTLSDPSATGVGAAARGPGHPGPYTRQSGMLAYYEICKFVKSEGWRAQGSGSGQGPHAYKNDQWVSYDDVNAVRNKARYIKNGGFGGAMVWTVDMDDFRNFCCGGAFPLLNALNKELRGLGGASMVGCATPAEPMTPAPPIRTTTYDHGSETMTTPGPSTPKKPTTWWKPEPVTTTTQTTQTPLTTKSSTWWQAPTTTKRTTWWQPPTASTTIPTTSLPLPTLSSEGFPCPANVGVGYYPHETDCTKYYICLHSKKVLAKCPAGTVFDSVKKICVIAYPSNSQCMQGGGLTLPTTARPTTSELPVVVVTDVCTHGNFYPHPYDCTKYHLCAHNTLVEKSCPARTSWNQERKHCTFTAPGGCHVTGSGTRSTQRPSTPKQPTTWWKPESTTMKESKNGEEYCQSDRMIRNEVECRRSSCCHWNTWEEGEASFHGNGRCWSSISDQACHDREQPATTQKCAHGQFFPDVNDCRRYAQCSHGNMVWNSCPAGTMWDNNRRLCVIQPEGGCHGSGMRSTQRPTTTKQPTTWWKPESTTMKESATTQKCAHGQFFPDANDCRRYAQCSHGKMVFNSCPVGTMWDNNRRLCVIQPEGGCQELSSRNPQPAALPEVCTEGPYIRHPTDCSVYFVCANGKLVQFRCQSNTHWDVEKQICNYPAEVGCTTTSEAGTVDQSGTSKPEPVQPEVQKPVITVTLPPVQAGGQLSPESYKVVCYFTNWAWYRKGAGKYSPEDIDASLCTHIVYGFAVLNYDTLLIQPHDRWADIDNNFYTKVTSLRSSGKKVLIAIGGWNDSAGDKYSRLVNSPASRRKFITNVITFIQTYGFDGLDLDWEYPKCWQVNCNKGPASDKPAFSAWVRELKEAFQPLGLLLSAAVSPSKTVVDEGYDVPEINRHLDWIAVMTYDFHGHWDKQTGHVAPMYHHPGNINEYFNADYSLNYWLSAGATKDKLVMGMPLYGQSFTLTDPNNHGLGATAKAPGQAGQFTKAAGFLAYYEICAHMRSNQWTVVKDPEGRMGPYMYFGNQWVGFDDVNTIRQKSQYIVDNGLAGGMIWALDLDDFRNTCGQGAHPLLKTITSVLSVKRDAGARPVTEAVVEETTRTTSGPGLIIPTQAPVVPQQPVTPAPVIQTQKPVTQAPVIQTQSPATQAPAAPSGKFKIVCYFTNWAWYRQGAGKYKPEDIDADLCTHIVYGFAVLDQNTLLIKSHDPWADLPDQYGKDFYKQVTDFRARGVKVLIAIGGWNDSKGPKYSNLVNSQQNRAKFNKHVVEYIKKYNFDGLDLDWEYPKCWQVDCKKGPESDKPAFALWVKELRQEFDKHGLLLSAAVSPSKTVVAAGYDVPSISRDLDWIAVMTYDYHGHWDKQTGHVAPLYDHPENRYDYFNANYSINYWLDHGADRQKLIMGLPMYGQSFTLRDKTATGLQAKTYGPGEAGQFTRARGFLAYYEICEYLKSGGWTVVQDTQNRMGPYAHNGQTWAGFDDIATIRLKSKYIVDNGLGGAMIWALDLDDFRNRCGCERHPLLRTINRELNGYRIPDPGCNDLGTGTVLQVRESNCVTGDLVADPIDCSTFKQCNAGKWEVKKCGDGLHFNSGNNVCDWPANAGCQSGGESVVETPTQSPTAQPAPPAVVVEEATQKPVVPAQPVQPVITTDSGYKVVCYFTNWAWYRPGIGKYAPGDIDPELCTHIVYGFAVLDPNNLIIKPHDTWADLDNKFYAQVTALKSRGVKVLIAIGGWNDSLGPKYSNLVNNAASRRKFNTHVLQFILDHNFDGLDLDWEYPKCWQVDCNAGPVSDKAAFATWVRELKQAFQPHGLLLSAAVSPSKKVVDEGYDVPTINQYLDWIAVMAYDFHGHWDSKTGHVAPLSWHPLADYDYFNANFTMHYWKQQGADAKKLIMGMPLYGQAFALANPSEHGLGAPDRGKAQAGEFTRAAGFLAYYEICDRVKNKGWTQVQDPQKRIGPYAYQGNQWVGYDDVAMIRKKSEYVVQNGFGGAMIWALDLDDFRNRCGCEPHPLLRTINRVLRGYSVPDPNCSM